MARSRLDEIDAGEHLLVRKIDDLNRRAGSTVTAAPAGNQDTRPSGNSVALGSLTPWSRCNGVSTDVGPAGSMRSSVSSTPR